MKKLVSAVLAVIFLSASATFAAPEINVKAGLFAYSDANTHEKLTAYGYTLKTDSPSTPDIGFQLGGEILFPIGSVIKLGGGVIYAFPRQADKDYKGNDPLKVSMTPIYFTAQINPISSVSGVFFKGAIGYSVLSFNDTSISIDYPDGALYLGIGTGYEFPFGLILDLSYNYYSSTSKSYTIGIANYEYSMSLEAIILSVGYKFKL